MMEIALVILCALMMGRIIWGLFRIHQEREKQLEMIQMYQRSTDEYIERYRESLKRFHEARSLIDTSSQ